MEHNNLQQDCINISVIIPVWNRESCITRAIKSVLNQTTPPMELIIIDDDSTDNTYKVITDYCNNYHGNIKCVIWKISHCGMPGKVRNIGMEKSNGNWIAFLDSDDEWFPQKLEKQCALITSSNIRWCHTKERWIHNGKEISQKKQCHKRRGNIFDDALKKCIIGPSTVMIARTMFEELGYFREDMEVCEDYELWLRFLNKYEIEYLDEPMITKFAGHENQLSQKYEYIEKFRIDALSHLIQNSTLKYNNNIKAQKELERKQYIWEQGRKKRNV